jgi:hypothetical protein
MPYTPTTWTSGVTPASQTNMNHLETQYVEAVNSIEHDLLTAFVLSGFTAAKDGSIANQLDVASGNAYVTQPDTALRLRSAGALTYTTATPSTTYYLDLNPDGTWSWGTSHSAVTNHLTICSVGTDGSGNISTVTDARTLATSLLPNVSGPVYLPTIRNGTLTWVPIFTGGSTPTLPPTGSMWLKA